MRRPKNPPNRKGRGRRKALNKVENEYLYSVKFTREVFGSIDFLQMNPIEAIEQFQHQRRMTKTGIFSPIAPYE